MSTNWPCRAGVLLEIEAGLESMHGIPKRIVYRDFSLWPVGAPFNDIDEAFKKPRGSR